MKRLNAALRIAFLLATTFATVFLSQAESRDKYLATTQHRKPAHGIQIVDQNGRPALSGVPSGTGQIFDVTVAPGALLLFEPTWFSISVGDTVRWTWDDDGHSVTSGELGTADGQFCSPDDMNCDQGILSDTGATYEHTFTQVGTYSYFCASHWAFGMVGMVNVLPTPSGLLYGSTGGDNVNGGGRLWLIDVTKHSASLVGDTGFDRLGGIAFDSNGILYGVSGGSNTQVH